MVRAEQEKKALFRVAKCYIKKGGEIINQKLLGDLLKIIKELSSSFKRKIWQKGVEEARNLRSKYRQAKVFDWCPQAEQWLEDLDYIYYLGVKSINTVKNW